MNVNELSYLDLLLAAVLVLATTLLSWWLQLGMQRDMLLGAARTFLQLALTGYILAFIFLRNEWYWTLLALAIMTGVAIHTAAGRVKDPLAGKYWVFTVALASGGLVVLAYVLFAVVRISPWFDARYVLPLAGMIMGNAMTAATLGVGRFVGDLRTRRTEVETALALGATATQATARLRREALRTAIIPSVNGMLVVGIVSLPGMMTGQIIAGGNATQAAHYQVMVMYMITAASSFASIIGVFAAARQSFTQAHQLQVAETV